MDVDALHRLTLNSDNAEASVTVNQRALIDKVLSRYSSENTLLRELLQNSDDANATSVKITYEAASKSGNSLGSISEDLNKRMTKRVTIRNNGQVFRPEDWSRLSRIAEGNPDEAKIGAFGVGFYSVFSVCEDPFVTSGDTGLAFYWRNDQLFTRTAKLPTTDAWTSFSLNMRQEIEIPNLKSLTKFLATSLTFSRSLSHIELWLDDLNLCTIKRVASPGDSLAVPSELAVTTPGKMLKITNVNTSSVQISATYLNATQSTNSNNKVGSKFLSFFSAAKPEPQSQNPDATTTSTIFLRVLTGALTSSLKTSFSAELQRATKKPPPRQTKIQLVTVSAAEYAASTFKAPIFENLLTFPNQGRVYIGFPTHQTTGFSGHVGAPCVIPTVERESIDLVDRFIRIWNFEVLHAIGLLMRIAYQVEFDNVKTIDEAIHTMKFFSMKTATPQNVDQTIEPTFFESCSTLPVYTSTGVQSTNKARLPDSRIRFLKNVPVLHEELLREVPTFVDRLKRLGYIEDISIGDIKRDLQDRVLSVSDGVMFLKYCSILSSDLDSAALLSLMRAGIIATGNDQAPVNVGYIKFYSEVRNIPGNVPLPSSCIPTAVSSMMSSAEMRSLGWQELSVVEWLNYNINCTPIGKSPEKDINSDPEFATLVLSVASKNFDALSTEDRARVTTMLRDRTCIPTKAHGMQKPDHTYFHTIKMFDDLPLILTMKGVKERFLVAIGVRKTIELNIIFDRLVAGGKWTAFDLVTYLASVRKDIPAKDIERLKNSPLANAEGHLERNLAKDLYEPSENLRLLKLPIIAWPKDKWRPSSEEAGLLYALGLQKYPSVETLLKIAGTAGESDVRERALNYFLLNFVLYNYGAAYRPDAVIYPFIPTESGKLENPMNIFASPACSIFGFEVLRKDLVDKATILGVQNNPQANTLVQILVRKPPQTHALAFAQFQLIAQLQPTFSKHDREQISQQAIIPVEGKKGTIRMVKPSKCFFKQANVESLYQEIFDFIDFGLHGNQFLRSIGVRDEPSTTQIAGMLVTDAANVWAICGSEDKYRQLLTQIATGLSNVKKDRHLFEALKRAKFLISYRYIESDIAPALRDDSSSFLEPQNVISTSLQKASDIVIVDDVVDFNLFRGDLQTCPQDIYLEKLYGELGSPRISTMILDRPITSGRPIANEMTTKLKADLMERLSVFLSDPSIQRKREVKDLANVLQVCMQEKVAMQRDLRFGQIQSSKRVLCTALVIHEGQSLRLVVSPKPDNYDISVAICKHVLQASKPGDYMLLDTLLTNSLKTLKARGYNVDRILQKQEKERKDKQLQREAAERQEEIDQAEARRSAQIQIDRTDPDSVKSVEAVQKERQDQVRVPGAFPESPARPSSSFMSNIKKSLGISRPLQSLPNTLPSPTINQTDQDTSIGPGAMLGSEIQAKPRPQESVTSQASVNQTLQKAIKMTRSSDDNSIFSPGKVDQIAEAKSFCDAKPAQDLLLAGTLPNGIKFYCNRKFDQSQVFRERAQSATKFSHLLEQIGEVFNVNSGSISICYDDTGPTIAFNKTGTIYCNLRFYSQLHEYLPIGHGNEAATYWYVTIAHELAHNLVSEHSSEHEFYMESMIVHYLPRLMPLLGQSAPPGYHAPQ